MASKTAANWIDELTLKRHPEGGWFQRVHESELLVDQSRPAMTSIYYLLEGSDFSALHRLQQDEQWHFYAGQPLTVHVIHGDGTSTNTTLRTTGPFQMTVCAGELFGATVDGDYALVGCTVAPGFDYSDFELPTRASLLMAYPEHEHLILQLTRD
jgi:predicted cupin superfamily sugar epimerase